MEITLQVSHVSPSLDIGNQEILTSNRTLTTLSAIPIVENYGQHTNRSLDDLPNEILGEIFRFVRLIGRYEEETYGRPVKGSLHLFNITRCSSRFHKIALPILYTDVFIKDYTKNLPIFLYKILAQPDLAKYVRRLDESFSSYSVDRNGRELCDMSRTTNIDQVRINTAIGVASNSNTDTEKWAESVEYGIWEAIIALIISAVPDPEALRLTTYTDFERDRVFIPMMFDSALDLPNRAERAPLMMKSLRHITLHAGHYQHGFRVTALMSFLRVKSLISLSFERMHQVLESHLPGSSILNFSSTIKQLTFQWCIIPHEIMIPFFRCFPFLEVLYYEEAHTRQPSRSHRALKPPHMMTALHDLRSSLTDLTIIKEYPREDPSYSRDELEFYPIGSFADFENMKLN